MVGPWRVSAKVVPVDQSDRQTYLAKRAVPTMDKLMEGKIEYHIEAPTVYDNESGHFRPRPLVFRKFTKADRPQAWKQCDLRVQSTLPLLGNDETANNPAAAMKEASGPGSVCDRNGGPTKSSTCLVRISLHLHDKNLPCLRR
jgi:hypothetical protein